MAKHINRTVVVTVNGVDLSDHASSAVIHTEFEDIDLTSFGAVYREHARGLGEASVSVTFFQDFAAGKVDATLWPLANSDTAFPVTVKPTNAAISTTNPEFQMTALLMSYDPMSGAVGEASETDVEFTNAAQSGLVRDVTP